MKRFKARARTHWPALALICLAWCGWAASAWPQANPQNQGARLSGTVRNGTTGKPADGVLISLLLPGQERMRAAASTRTDARGRFQLTLPDGAGMVLLAASYEGVNYFQPVQADQKRAKLKVYQAITDTRQLRISELATVLQPEKGQLAVVNEYVVHNQLSPPRTWYKPGGIFRFRIPKGIQADGAQVIGPDGMTVQRRVRRTQQAGIYTLNYPLRPGETRLQVSYRLPYSPAKAAIQPGALYPIDELQAYIPSPMRFHSPGFRPLGTQDGYMVYGLAHPAASLEMRVAGNAPLPQAMQSAAASDGGAASASSSAPTSAPATVPATFIPPKSFIEQNFGTLLAGLGLMAAALLFYMLRQPATATNTAQFAPPATPPERTASAGAAEAGVDDLQRLKNDLFLLEVRRHTGDISAAEYEIERARIEERTRKLLTATRV